MTRKPSLTYTTAHHTQAITYQAEAVSRSLEEEIAFKPGRCWREQES